MVEKRTEAHGIIVEDHPYDQGYWARYNGEKRPARKGARRDGWDQCDLDEQMQPQERH